VLWWTIQPSRILWWTTLTGQLLSSVLILLLSPDAGSTVLLLLAVYRYCNGYFVSESAVRTIHYHRQTGWMLQSGAALPVPAVLARVYRLGYRWLLVRFQEQVSRQAITLVLAPDSLAERAYGRLYRQLRWADKFPIERAHLPKKV